MNVERTKSAPQETEEKQPGFGERALRQYVEDIILVGGPVEINKRSERLLEGSPARERAEKLYEKVMAFSAHRRAIREGGDEATTANQRLLSDITVLWNDPETQALYLSRSLEANRDRAHSRGSELGSRYTQSKEEARGLGEEYKQKQRALFLQQVQNPLDKESYEEDISYCAAELIAARAVQADIEKLEGYEQTPENADAVALIHFSTLDEYASQLKDENFAWLPYQQEQLRQLKQQTNDPIKEWPLLMGESGTGKSALAEAAALELTGAEMESVPCDEKTGDNQLIGRQEIRDGLSFIAYSPLVRAATGYADSHPASQPLRNYGCVVRLDEITRLSDTAFALIKQARQIRPGQNYYGRTVLPGFSVIATANPPGPRYTHSKAELLNNPAFTREFQEQKLDYPPMSAEDPQLYDLMVAGLLTESRNLRAARSELAPAYVKQKVADGKILEKDGRQVVAEQKLVENRTDASHGILYRLAFAIRDLQDAFITHNDRNGRKLLNWDMATKTIKETGGVELTIANKVITPGTVIEWMRGFNNRFQEDDPNARVGNLTLWVHYKLFNLINTANYDDKDKLEAIFKHYHLLDVDPDLEERLKKEEPLTPKEIGYLSPRVPRPLELKDLEPKEEAVPVPAVAPQESPVQVELHQTFSLTLEDGSSILTRPRSMHIPHPDKTIYLAPGSRFRMGAEWFSFAGTVEDPSNQEHNGKLVVRVNPGDPDSGLHRLLTQHEVTEQGEEFWPFENEQMSHERLLNQYVDQVETLKQTGVLESISAGEWGVKGVDGKMYKVPAFEQVMERILKSQELLRPKVEQGFGQLLLVPIGMPIGGKEEESKIGNKTRYKYGGLLGSYTALMRDRAKARGGKLLAEKANPADPEELLVFDGNDPLYVWDTLQNADLPGATEPLIYYPKKFDAAAHGGITKAELLANGDDAGWEILLTQDLPVIPHEGAGKTQGNRPPMESKGSNPHIRMASGIDTPSINEYLDALQNPAGSPYEHEVGLTPEAWLTMAIHRMNETSQVLDDYQGKGKVSFLVGSFCAGDVPSGDFYRGNGRAYLGGDVPGSRVDSCGVRSAVRVP